ncbi:MAG: hypothetical protein AB7T49_14655 [Oligoflexales bacterium]
MKKLVTEITYLSLDESDPGEPMEISKEQLAAVLTAIEGEETDVLVRFSLSLGSLDISMGEIYRRSLETLSDTFMRYLCRGSIHIRPGKEFWKSVLATCDGASIVLSEDLREGLRDLALKDHADDLEAITLTVAALWRLILLGFKLSAAREGCTTLLWGYSQEKASYEGEEDIIRYLGPIPK